MILHCSIGAMCYSDNMSTITILACLCDQCQWQWVPDNPTPKQCPRCRSKKWNEGLTIESKNGKRLASAIIERHYEPD